MFTGLIEEIGTLTAIDRTSDSFALTIRAKTVIEDITLGASIAVNGVCLSATHFDRTGFSVGLAPETLARTNLGALKVGDPVNLERALTPTTRMGGHLVQGHVDGTGTLEKIRPDRDALWITIKAAPDLMRYIVTKGYITIDGTSLTVVDTGADWFNITLIAWSRDKVILPRKKPGHSVNLEVDIFAKYIERLMLAPHSGTPDTGAAQNPVTRNFLEANGFLNQGTL